MTTEFKDHEISSVLNMQHIVFDEISFKRYGFSPDNHQDAQLKIGAHVEKLAEGQYAVSLMVEAKKENEYTAYVRLTGYCEIDEATPHKDGFLNENAVAILFPYARAEMTLLTAQPEVEPLIIPIVNISAMLKQNRKGND